METLITLLVILGIIAVAWWAITKLTLPPPIQMIAVVVIAIVCIIVLMGLLPGGPHLNFR